MITDQYLRAADTLRRVIREMDPSLSAVRVEKILADPVEHNRWADEFEAAHPDCPKLTRATI